MENATASTPITSTSRLYRSASDKVVAGVCGGLASYFKIDPAIVRIAFVAFALIGGASVLLYLVLWIAVPLGDVAPSSAPRIANNDVLAALLIAAGGVWLLSNLGLFRLVNWSFAWPLVLVALGVALLVRRS